MLLLDWFFLSYRFLLIAECRFLLCCLFLLYLNEINISRRGWGNERFLILCNQIVLIALILLNLWAHILMDTNIPLTVRDDLLFIIDSANIITPIESSQTLLSNYLLLSLLFILLTIIMNQVPLLKLHFDIRLYVIMLLFYLLFYLVLKFLVILW